MRSLFQPLLILSLLLSGCQPSSQSPGNSTNSEKEHTSRQRSDYPRRTVTIVCPWGVGGGTDRISRYFADALRRQLGKPFIVINKTDLAPYVGVDVEQMVADATLARDGRTVLALSRTDAVSVAALREWVLSILAAHRDGSHVPQDPGPMAPHFHADEEGGGFLHSHADGEHAHAHADGALHDHADHAHS